MDLVSRPGYHAILLSILLSTLGQPLIGRRRLGRLGCRVLDMARDPFGSRGFFCAPVLLTSVVPGSRYPLTCVNSSLVCTQVSRSARPPTTTTRIELRVPPEIAGQYVRYPQLRRLKCRTLHEALEMYSVSLCLPSTCIVVAHVAPRVSRSSTSSGTSLRPVARFSPSSSIVRALRYSTPIMY